MKLYLLFLLVATATVMSPGPGVLMTITNSLRGGFRHNLGGIFGIAAGAFVVAAISATSLGVLLATSVLAFTAMKLIGAAYLVYLGVRLWLSPKVQVVERAARHTRFHQRFTEGISLQLTNPKVVVFFLSIFPQFISQEHRFAPQFAVLVLSYSTLVLVIHSLYSLFAHRARSWLTSPRGSVLMNRASGATFIFFGAALATAKR